MFTLKDLKIERGRKKWDDEPVLFCRNCLSLKILNTSNEGEGVDYCDECGSTLIGSTDIDKWKKLYRQKYNKDYVKE